MTHLLTPWGTQRIAINTLPTNATNGTGNASVRSIFEAFTGLNGTTMNTSSNSSYGLTGRGLQNIYNGNFSTKYTSLGVKQIAANILQMRDPNTFSISASGNYSGQLLGSDNLDANDIPKEYLGYAPYPVISEVGFSCLFCYEYTFSSNLTTNATTGVTTNKTTSNPIIRIAIQPTVELYNPYPYDFIFQSGYPRLIMAFRDFQFDIAYQYPESSSNQTKTISNNATVAAPFTSFGGFHGIPT